MNGRAGILIAATLTPPLLVATAWVLIIAGGERAGHRPFAAPRYRNSAEAAAAGDAATMLRMLRLGDNATWVHQVRPDLISSAIVRVSTLEAALWSRHPEMVRALDREGAIVGSEQRHELACLARDLDMPEVADHLAPGAACVPDEAVKRVVRRSTGREGGGGDE
jgi:hypothetical protein